MIRPGWRRGAAIVCFALALVGLLASVWALYLRANVWEREGFSRNAAEALQDSAVSAFVSKQLVVQIVAKGSEDLVAAQPALEAAMPLFVRSSLFTPVFERAAAEVHRSLLDGRPDSQGLVLDLTDLGIVLNGFLQGRRPQLASTLPEQIRDAFIRVSRGGAGRAFVDAARASSWLAFVLPAATAILFLGALLAARDRRRLLALAGVGAVGVAIVVWVVSAAGTSALRDETSLSLNPRAADGVFDAFLGDVPRWSLILAAAGALLAAVAATGLREAELNGRLRRAWRAVAVSPRDEWGRALRAAALVGIGAIVVVRWEAALRVTVVAVGLYLVVLGLAGLVRQAERFSTRRERAPSPGRGRLAVAAVATFCLAVGGLAAGLALAFGGSGGGARPVAAPGQVLRCNGYAALCDRRLDQVVFPATHNSMSAASAGFLNANQPNGIVTQLDAGIRGLLIDDYNGAPGRLGRIATEITPETRATAIREIGKDGLAAIERVVGRLDVNGKEIGATSPYLCHIVCELGATNAVEELTRIHTWLVDHPDEVLVVFVQDEGVTPDETRKIFAESGLLGLVYTHRPGAPWPTLRQMIARHQRLFVLAEHVAAPGTWYHQGFDLFQETPYDLGKVSELESPEGCRPNRGPADAPLFLLNNWVATYPPKPSNARIVNAYPFLLDRARRCEAIRHHLPNLIAVDFYNRGDVVGVADTLNGVSR